MQITVDKTGEAEYREAPDDELPLKFKLTEAETQRSSPWPTSWTTSSIRSNRGLKVAFMGTKTFRFENGAREDRSEVQLLRRIPPRSSCWTGSSAWRNPRSTASTLERAAKYDKLGVVKALTPA